VLWVLAGAICVLVIGVVLGVTVLRGGSSSITSHGTMEVEDYSGSCRSDAGYSDITDGTQVVVTNSTGTVIGTGTLSYDGNVSKALSSAQSGLSACVYDFTVSVPGGLPRYGITVSHRGTIWFDSGQMESGPGLTLGSNSGTGNSGNSGNSGNTGNTSNSGNTGTGNSGTSNSGTTGNTP